MSTTEESFANGHQISNRVLAIPYKLATTQPKFIADGVKYARQMHLLQHVCDQGLQSLD
jgi:hypothetical protein